MGRMIHVGDCIPWLESLGDASVDVTIADPPYSEHVHAKSLTTKGQDKKRRRSDPIRRDLGFQPLTPSLRRDFAIEVARVTKRWVLIFSDEENIGAWRYDLQGAGLEVIRVCPWIKPNGAPQMTGDRPGSAWEPIVVAHRSRGGKPVAKHWNGGGHKGYFVHNLPKEQRVHQTEKPVSLMLELVHLFSDRGELVADPFAGAATTGVACIRLGRRFLGAELDASIADIATRRLAAESEGHGLREHDAGQATLFGALPSPAPDDFNGFADGDFP